MLVVYLCRLAASVTWICSVVCRATCIVQCSGCLLVVRWMGCLCRVQVPSTVMHCYSNRSARQKSGNKYCLNTIESNSWQRGTILMVFQSRLVDHTLFAIWIMRRRVVTDTAFVTGKGKIVRVLKFFMQGPLVLMENVGLRQGDVYLWEVNP